MWWDSAAIPNCHSVPRSISRCPNALPPFFTGKMCSLQFDLENGNSTERLESIGVLGVPSRSVRIKKRDLGESKRGGAALAETAEPFSK